MSGTLKRQVHQQENGPVHCGILKQCCSWFILDTTYNIKDDLNDIIQNESGQRIMCVLFNMIAVSVEGIHLYTLVFSFWLKAILDVGKANRW